MKTICHLFILAAVWTSIVLYACEDHKAAYSAMTTAYLLSSIIGLIPSEDDDV